MQCIKCGKETENPKFCSQSCSASFNNKLYLKRKPTHNCQYCGKIINAKRRYCSAECKNLKLEKEKHIKSLSKIKPSINAIRWRQRIKIKAIEHMGGACKLCGYNKCIRSMNFHHLDPNEKEFGIGNGCCKSWDKVKTELKKCVLLCSNCHNEVHDGVAKI